MLFADDDKNDLYSNCIDSSFKKASVMVEPIKYCLLMMIKIIFILIILIAVLKKSQKFIKSSNYIYIYIYI